VAEQPPAVLTAFTRVAARDLALGPISRTGLAGLDLSVAASRVYVGVHYPSDVVSGLLIGRAIGTLLAGAPFVRARR
jgi:membrane-associated phospholipid phosphatase